MDDLKEKIQEAIEKIKNDKDFAENFTKEPIKTVEDLLGVDLPDDQINQIVDAVKSKINIDDNISGIANTIKGLFNK